MKLTTISTYGIKNGELIIISLIRGFTTTVPIIGRFYKTVNEDYYSIIQDEVYITNDEDGRLNHYQHGDSFKLTRKWVDDVRTLTFLERCIYKMEKYSLYE